MKGGVRRDGRGGAPNRRTWRPGSGRLIVAAIADEVHSSLGADALVQSWRADCGGCDRAHRPRHRRPHTKGFQWITVETRGRAAHGSDTRMAATRSCAWAASFPASSTWSEGSEDGASHELLGTASLHASIIDGGES
jgi:acetylornithine deacetylase